MKNLIYLIGISFLISSCSGEDEAKFVLETEARFEIPAGLNTIETHFFIIKDVPTFFTSQSGIIGSDTSRISRIVARRAILKPRFDNINLDNINSVNVYLLDKTDPTSRDEIFFMDFIELRDKQEIKLFSTIRDVKEFLVEDEINIEVAINYRGIPLTTTEFMLDMSFSVFE